MPKETNHDYHNPDYYLFRRQRGLSGDPLPVDDGGEIPVTATSLVIPDAVAKAFTESCREWYRIQRSQRNGHGRLEAYRLLRETMGDDWLEVARERAASDLDWIESRFDWVLKL